MSRVVVAAALTASALSLMGNAALATALYMRTAPAENTANNSITSNASLVSSTSEVDAVCVAVLSHGGKPQDCARIYLYAEFPGYPR